MGVSDVPINPSENEPPSEAPTISIHTASFSLNNNIGHNAKTYTLHLRVQCSPNSCYNSESDGKKIISIDCQKKKGRYNNNIITKQPEVKQTNNKNK